MNADPPAGSVISAGDGFLGIEFGSTRIKAALVDVHGRVLAVGSHSWENRYEDGNWTYPDEDIWAGLQDCYRALCVDVRDRYGVDVRTLGAIGVSAMMHGYLGFAGGELLVPFRTWRNTYTTEASRVLTEEFGRNVPLRWSASHLLHAALGGEEHVRRLDYLTTLAGYVHWRLSGRKVLGVGDASGMFPIDSASGDYDATMMKAFDALPAVQQMPWRTRDVLPEVVMAGGQAGRLTEAGARLLDPSGALQAGALMAAPEGDAGTGMVATNCVRPRTGNVSAGTSAFAMVVLESELPGAREEIDPVTTPSGDPVAMIHTNNCTGDLDRWVGVFAQFASLLGLEVSGDELYASLYQEALKGDVDAGGVYSYNYLSGEHQTHVEAGVPLLVQAQGSALTLANLMRAHLYGAFAALAAGVRVLLEEEQVGLDVLFAHGGIFRTSGVAQQILADALGVPVAVGGSAGEGGAWGMAVLAAYTAAVTRGDRRDLSSYLREVVFEAAEVASVTPTLEGSEGYRRWLQRYLNGLPAERSAGQIFG